VLCIKTGNAVILRGGSESILSNTEIAAALQAGGESAGLPPHAVQLVPITDRAAVRHMAAMSQYIDLIVPRGGRGLIEAVMEHARMPVIKHLDGVCHIYVDEAADAEMAAEITFNAKVQRPSACNAAETLLIHQKVSQVVLATLAPRLAAAKVQLRADAESLAILSDLNYPNAIPAQESDWGTEFLDLVLAVRIVDSLDEAISHIENFGSHHSDAIITSDEVAAEKFLNAVDSATVYWNASTRFTDGGEFGFGAEIGISTDKLHARGPMALEELTTYRYLIRGTGQTRS
jgi:glutamate-5-semialdehyde dehydrogenase